MSGWDYWRGTFDSVSAQAQAAASQASKFAEVVSTQVSEQSKHIAAQASTYSAAAAQHANDFSKAAAESAGGARAQLAGLNLPEALANLHLSKDGSGPTEEQLAAFAITPEFCTFIRGLTYSTFRDFPQEELEKLMAERRTDGGAASATGADPEAELTLSPWQAQHATLVCLAVQEMNELRFVLVPKRLKDEEFWAIYYALTRSRLPPEAFDLELQRRAAERAAADAAKLKEPETPGQPPSKTGLIRPAAVTPENAGEEQDDGRSKWLRNLVCGFEVDIPTERLQQDTIVLGALHNSFQQLSESARNIHLPDNLRQNLDSARGLIGMPGGAQREDGDGAAQAEAASPGRSDAAAAPAAAAARNDGGGSASPAPSPDAEAVPHRGNGDAAQQAEPPAPPAAAQQQSRGASAASLQALDDDPDLEAYLKEMAGSDAGDDDDANSAASLDDGDFDKYLKALSASGGGSEAGSGSGEEVDLDLDEYLAAAGEASDDEGGPETGS